ncbi:MAG: RNase adapter RapZ [Thiogranum sp.]|nr:RNase adapter RapZ [Thiogranum sp.]
MKLVIVSGLSGSGKSIALHTLEDCGYYCIDNLPAGLLEALAVELGKDAHPTERVAVGIDARNLPDALQHFDQILDTLKARNIDTEILFLSCESDTLIKRFSETRRRHPLSNDKISLPEAVQFEQTLLEPIAARASLFIDTTQTTVHQLRDLVHKRLQRPCETRMSLLFESFGYKHGIPTDADYVFDARCLPNPHWQPDLRPLTGRDAAVIEYLEKEPNVARLYTELCTFLENWIPAFEADRRSYLTVAVGCTGGQHRSVYLTERMAQHFARRYPNIATHHRELS